MVYYGSCDQRKPECLKCEVSNIPCPGYRDLHHVIFRDESKRIISKCRERNNPAQLCVQDTGNISLASWVSNASLPESARFFFAKYACNEPNFEGNYYDWLVRSYVEANSHDVIRTAIEAVGTAGMSNVLNAPQLASKSRQRYGEALTAMQHALNDRTKAVADTTLMAVILLGMFETINLENCDQYHSWKAHVEAAMTLLELRGSEQFLEERGAVLYVQVRSQIVFACWRQAIRVPAALVQSTFNFATGVRKQWEMSNMASPGSICEISYRTINLRAAIRAKELTDPHTIYSMAADIDTDLECWRDAVPWRWRYRTVGVSEMSTNISFEREQHVYPNLWVAEAWNSWRTLRVLINKIIIRDGTVSGVTTIEQRRRAIAVVRQCSTDLCISSPSFIGTPRALSLIRPLYMVSREEYNLYNVRTLAAKQLKRIEQFMGIRGSVFQPLWSDELS